MEIVNGFNPIEGFTPRQPHEDPQIDFQCAVADIRDMGYTARRNINDLLTRNDKYLKKKGISHFPHGSELSADGRVRVGITMYTTPDVSITLYENGDFSVENSFKKIGTLPVSIRFKGDKIALMVPTGSGLFDQETIVVSTKENHFDATYTIEPIGPEEWGNDLNEEMSRMYARRMRPITECAMSVFMGVDSKEPVASN